MPHEVNHSDEEGQGKIRIDYLEKLARSNLYGMDLLASLGELNHDAALSGDPEKIMALAGEHLQRLIPFNRMAFYRIEEPNSEFALSLVEPSRERQHIEQDINEQIDNGNFAWAVRQNRPVVVSQNGGGGLLVLHVLATRSRVRGMFVAVLTGTEHKIDEALLHPLSIILQNTAYGLEGAELYRLIAEKNNNLENTVRERTRELEEQAAQLKEEIAHRSLAEGSLSVAREEVGAGVRIKSDFIAHISHEFKTPLNAILGYGEILKFEAQKMNRDDLVEDLESIETSGKHLLRLVNDILDFSKIEAGKVELKFESVKVPHLIEEVMSTIRPLVKKNDNVISVIYQGGDETMYSDPTRVRQILLNLLSNACKFSEDGSIVLTVSSKAAEDKPWLQFTVQDSGVGIEPEKILTLFKEFTQGEVTTLRKFGGTGLGLAICHRLCQMLGGDISVSSKPGRGSVFTVNLPADSRLVPEKRVYADREDAAFDVPEEDIQIPEGEFSFASEPATVEKEDRDILLVIDDDQIVRDLVKRFSEREGYRVESAAGGEEGLARARELRPNAILLDVMMPGMDGWEVLTVLKKDRDLSNIPVIMLTVADEKETARSLGATDYLLKPLDWQNLFEILKKHRTSQPKNPILVLEDDIANRKALCRLLGREGWKVLEARNCNAAFKILQKTTPGLILLDLMLSGMNGFEFITRLKQNPAWRSVPILVVTARDLSEEEKKSLEGLVARIFKKGDYSLSDLLFAIGKLMYRTQPAEPPCF